jgi:glycosyltransferase involved in cell wall biosynthesis
MKHKDPHIVYIITKLELGGAQKVCLTLFKQIQQQMGASLIAGSDGYLVHDVANHPNLILLDDFKREISCKSIFTEIRLFIRLVRTLMRLKRKHPDLIVHTHSTKAGIVGRWAAFFARIKYRIHTIHGYAFHEHQHRSLAWLIIAIEWLTSLITTHFVCVSLHDARTGMRLFSGFDRKHTIIRAAVDWQQFYLPARQAPPFPAAEAPFIFGTIACFKPQKNLFDLLQAFLWAYQRTSNIRLEIIGDGHQRTAILAWIEQHKLWHVITLHGWQAHVAPIMAQWHAFVLSSLWEGLPCAVVEARLLKLPVLSYNTGGIADIINHDENGLLFKQKDWLALGAAMVELSTNQEQYQKLSNHTEHLEDFCDTQMIEQHIKLYTTIYHKDIY